MRASNFNRVFLLAQLFFIGIVLSQCNLNGAFISKTNVAGQIKAKFKTDSHGSATYTISLDLPPGTNGLKPNLSFVYNSSSQNGLMGMGWNLKGTSVLTRGTKTRAVDGTKGMLTFSPEDRFYLDGTRLINIDPALSYGSDGCIYHKEKEDWDRVIQHGAQGDRQYVFYHHQEKWF